MQTNILFTGDIIYWWINNTGEIIWCLNALFGSMQPVWAQHSVRVRRSLNLWEQSPPPLIWYVGSHESDQSTRKTEGSLTPKAHANAASVITHQLSLSSRRCWSCNKSQFTTLKLQTPQYNLWCPRCGKCGRNRGMKSYNGIYRITRNVMEFVEVWMN